MKIAVFMNSVYLGGAEKSIILQMKELQRTKQSMQVHFFFPSSNISESCLHFINENIRQVKVFSVCLDKRFYQMSRINLRFGALLQGVQGFISTLVSFNKVAFKNYDVLWCNGNKVASVVGLIHAFSNYPSRIIWHLRDYCPHNFILSFVFRVNKRIEFIANSNSVASSLLKTHNRSAKIVYNPVLPNIEFSPRADIKKIALASMHAPWKGIHVVLRMVKVYEKELRELDIKTINVYGDMIYETKGNHNHYSKDLQRIAYDSKLVQFRGLCSSREIFSSNDLLIHSSIKEEPFGRVILEAFQSGVPVISTALGGASELVVNKETGYVYHSHDIHDLFNRIVDVIDGEKRSEILTSAYQRSKYIQEHYEKALADIF